MAHRLLQFLLDAAIGRFPEPDGGVTVLSALPNGSAAVVAFTGHAVVATSLTPDRIAGLHLDGFGGALAPAALLAFARGATIGTNDVTLVGRGRDRGGTQLRPVTEWDDHPRVRFARSLRTDVVVYGDERGFVTLGSGLAGRLELSVEVVENLRGTGTGRALLSEALGLVSANDFVFAAVSPGNARSLRAFLSQGFVPVASEVIFTARPDQS